MTTRLPAVMTRGGGTGRKAPAPPHGGEGWGEAENVAGEPEKVEFGERIVGIIESRDGTIMDVVRQIKPFQFKEEKKVLPESVHK